MILFNDINFFGIDASFARAIEIALELWISE